ncbi:hypothetical protein OA408_02460 [Acidimicrobiaceae bacterium]|nr:hypothetical protein [Acidimicrobiaceae bacterium]|tara:strand:+ start:316 stop:513 length:198 start_codon:yes stop_codon:yes gene_type:complete
MNDINNLEKNFNENIDKLKDFFDELNKDLNTKLESVKESKELLEVLESYKLKIQYFSNSLEDEEE